MRANLTDLCSFIMLDGVGHWPHLEAPDATNAALLAFLGVSDSGGLNMGSRWSQSTLASLVKEMNGFVRVS